MTAADRPLSTDALHLLTTDPGPWLSCDDCFRLVDRYVEAVLADGTEPPDDELAAMPAHLSGCSACAEEAPALVDRGQGHPSACHFAEARTVVPVDAE